MKEKRQRTKEALTLYTKQREEAAILKKEADEKYAEDLAIY